MQRLMINDIEAIERAAARAWPPSRIENVGGWMWRGSGGGSRRANSVLPIGFDGTDVEIAIDQVEELYRAEKTRSYFQVSSASTPLDLDQRLHARGYTYEEPCLLMAKSLMPSPMPDHVTVRDAPDDAWLSIYTEPLDAARKAAAPGVLAVVPNPKAYFLVTRGGEALASALAVLEPATGIVLIECVATRSDRRRTGAARIVMDALESWGAANGGTVAALQVTEHNTAARTLYDKRGYASVGRYHYRWKDV